MFSGENLEQACVIALTETWLDVIVSDAEVDHDNFTILWVDSTTESGKERGRSVSMYANNRRCDNIKNHSMTWTPNADMLILSLHPFHLPREFSHCCHQLCVYSTQH